MIPKFRAWEPDTNFMNDQVRVTSNRFGDGEILVEATDGFGWIEVKPEYLMQSTGLKDKNGVEIFEGDVLTSNVQPCKMVNPIKDGYGVVRFENGMFKLGAISLVTFISKMEVIGNIYENPELLEQADES
ncbi:YopX family protein [Enterococcus innesii]|nr:YopX family protein [Enterococcus innesii]